MRVHICPQKLLESLRINKHYEQLHVWEEMLMQPIMQDMMREVGGWVAELAAVWPARVPKMLY